MPHAYWKNDGFQLRYIAMLVHKALYICTTTRWFKQQQQQQQQKKNS